MEKVKCPYYVNLYDSEIHQYNTNYKPKKNYINLILYYKIF